jgi:metallo-beta-lactamase family protein
MTIRLSFHGAARTVTGSCFVLETDKARVMIDCGMFQGSKTLKALNYGEFPVPPATLDAVLLTHAHIDHSGLLPKLMLAGYQGSIYATSATNDLLACMLPDSGHIQEIEVEQLNRRATRRGHDPVTPIYTARDAVRLLEQLSPVTYGEWSPVAKGIRARWWNAAHLLGSGSVEVEAEDRDGKPLRLLFSGDIGPDHKLLHPDPDAPEGFDVVVCESTYGDRDRDDPTPAARIKTLAEVVTAAQRAGGALVIPSFAVERTQELVTDLVGLIEAGTVQPFQIFVDSPLASKATEVFKEHAGDLDNGEALLRAFGSPYLRMSETVEDSKAIARIRGFHVIIAASGMCDAGRIRHHLRNWLHRPNATVLLVGYQAQGTLGRLLLDGESAVRIQGDEILVKATIRTIDSYSGHADATELLDWVKARLPVRLGLFLVHGEEPAMTAFEQRLADDLMPRDRIFLPALDETFEIGRDAIRALPSRAVPRLEPAAVAQPDWHNDLSKLMLTISQRIDAAADERAKKVILRRLQRALEE